MSRDCSHNIAFVSLRTGLSPHVIRIWERRYQAIEPGRTCSNRRLYSDRDVERLTLLKRLTARGHRIGLLAPMSMEDLRALHDGTDRKVSGTGREDKRDWLGDCLRHIKELDGNGLQSCFDGMFLAHGFQQTVTHLLAPLIETIGSLWEEDKLGISHEHLATATIREFLASRARPYSVSPKGPEIIVTTPSGQWHELGAMLVSACAWDSQWKVVYLGASIPAKDIATAARSRNAGAIALSIVYPLDDPALAGELASLRKMLPADFPIIVGGRGVGAYAGALDAIGALIPGSIAGLLDMLTELRSGKNRLSTAGGA